MSTWTEQEKYANQTAIQYNEAVQYNDPIYQYNGKEVTTWTEQTKN